MLNLINGYYLVHGVVKLFSEMAFMLFAYGGVLGMQSSDTKG